MSVTKRSLKLDFSMSGSLQSAATTTPSAHDESRSPLYAESDSGDASFDSEDENRDAVFKLTPKYNKMQLHTTVGVKADITQSIQARVCLQSINDKCILHISQFVERIEHFTILSKINQSFYKTFSVKQYFNAAVPIKAELYERDASYFRDHIRKSLLDKNGSILTLNGGIVGFNAGFTPDEERLRALVAYYLIFYDKLRCLQRRYMQHVSPKRRALPMPRGANRLGVAVYAPSRVSILTAFAHIYPSILRTICIDPEVETLTIQDARYLSRIWHYSGPNSPVTDWLFEECGLSDGHIRILATGLYMRRHFSTVSTIDFSDNTDISDDSMTLFFSALGANCPKVKKLDLKGTGIGNKTCRLIGDYFVKHFNVKRGEVPNVIWKHTKVTTRGEEQFMDIVGLSMG